MFLLPQHFQQAERSLDASLQLRLHGENPLAWGLIGLELDEAAVGQGRIDVVRCQAVLPDGLTVDTPAVDPAPASRTFTLPASGQSLDVYLAVPAHRTRVIGVSADPANGAVRFLEEVIEAPDVQEPDRVQPIEIAHKNLRIVFSGEPLDGLVAIRIAQVHRNAEGLPALRREFIPACLGISAAPALQRLGRDILGIVVGRARSLAEERRRRGASNIDFNAAEILSFWFLHTLNGHIPALQLLVEQPGTPPIVLYEELLRLTGHLSTFAGRTETELGAMFSLETLTESFTALERRLRELMSILFRTQYEFIPLVRKDAFWTGHIGDTDLRRRGDFFLAVAGDMPPGDIVSRVPNACKIAEVDAIERLVRTHVGGVRIAHVPRPPGTIPVRTDTLYFRVQTEGPDWEQIEATGHIALYLPSWLPGLRLELIGVRNEAEPRGPEGPRS